MNTEVEPITEIVPIMPLSEVVEEPVVPTEDQVEETRTKLRKIPHRSLPRSAMNLPATRLDPRDQKRGWKPNPRQQGILKSKRLH